MLLSCDAIIGAALVVTVVARVLVSFTRQTMTNNGRRSFFTLQKNWGMPRKFCFNCNQFRPEPGTILTRSYKEAGLPSANSGLQLGSGDRVKRLFQRRSSPTNFFSPAKDALKRRVT